MRPTADRVKESLFNILTVLLEQFDGLRVVDVFAGTGNLGIEALSRGAASCIFIDSHRESVTLIRKNLEACRFAERSRIIQKNALSALQLLDNGRECFDVIFLDPPYEKTLAIEALNYLGHSDLIHDTTIVIAELASRETIPASFGRLKQFDKRTYGDTMICFFRSVGRQSATSGGTATVTQSQE